MRVFYLLFSLLLLGATPAGTRLSAPDAPTIVIDAGHGGVDRGAKRHSPYCEEKKLCLTTAKLVRKYLDQLGYHVVLTRNADSFLSLSKRVQIARQAGANIFVSIHYNSSKSPKAHGIEVFFCDKKGTNMRSVASRKLANSVLTRLTKRTGASSRGVKKGNFHVIRETSMPAILVEGGFVSNPKERALLKTLAYQKKIAQGIADGVDQYFKARWRSAKKRKK